MHKKVTGRRKSSGRKTGQAKKKSGSGGFGDIDIRLVRRKSVYNSAREAWNDIENKTGIKPGQVKGRHTDKAWVWIRKR